ncbi:YafY family protein [Tropicibacter sp. Alg240-R139]|uniref:helix-turn-helix transcriptional regulator n=1 Tax=Tropicibacter sp. Alg240-R139 TaxID=2305991 RepID=UPI0013DFB74D|nr:YafY family protein [Tropicibacter sp. Alg240-R139]
MRSTERLFQIIQILRSTKAPITGRELADELEISLSTLYRDMAELHAQRIPITGEAGVGYVLDDGYDMPPLMLTADELEAAALGAAWVASEADPSLSRAARDLVVKLSEAIPKELRPVVLDGSSKPIQTHAKVQERFDGALLRHAIRKRYRLQLVYADREGQVTDRIVWPLFIAFLDRARYLVGWCETKQDYRHFKTERVQELKVLGDKYPGRRAALLKGWEATTARR